jgi:membrane associated rhomboid family serine protease
MDNIVGNPSGTAADNQAKAEALTTRGNELLLRHTRAADAAGTFSQALQLAPQLVSAHLGMAEANFALGQTQIARTATDYVQRLAPGAPEGELARALQLAIDRQFDSALDLLDQITRENPGLAYAHALRGYVLRSLRRDYDAALAEAKAARLASAVDMRPLFPRIEPVTPQYAAPFDGAPAGNGAAPRLDEVQRRPPQDAMRRQAIRINFATRGQPVVTYCIIAVCSLVFLGQLGDPNITAQFEQYNYLVTHGEPWRLVTTMFLHANILHIFTNMLSLYFLGPLIERIYGAWRYLLIYFGSGLVASVAFLLATGPNGAAVGASGAIAGVFGAVGAFFFAYRSQLGPVANSILQQWLFWLTLNIIFNVSDSQLAWQAHLGGLVAGIVLGLLLAPQGRQR